MDPGGRRFLSLTVDSDDAAVKGLASPVRLQILRLLRRRGPLNVNEVSASLDLPQSTVANHLQLLEAAELIETRTQKASKGQQKVCSVRYDEIVIRLDGPDPVAEDGVVEVAMPLGLYTTCDVTAPCGLCSTESVIGLLDVPDNFLNPNRMSAALIWFNRGFVEYKFPNNAKVLGAEIDRLEFSMEVSSEVPGTNTDWPSDVSLWVNHVCVGTWTSPGDYGDRRGTYTPRWWKLEGSQYGNLVVWRITREGTFVGDQRISAVTLDALSLSEHHAIRMRIGIADGARRPGGLNLFGRGFGNHDQDIVLKLFLRR